MSLSVRAKFICMSITKTVGSPSGFRWSYKFNPVYGNTEENKKFWEATPSGSIEISGIRDDLFEVGKEYYVDFTPSE